MELAKDIGNVVPGQPVKKICLDCLEGKSADEDRVPGRLVFHFSFPRLSPNYLME